MWPMAKLYLVMHVIVKWVLEEKKMLYKGTPSKVNMARGCLQVIWEPTLPLNLGPSHHHSNHTP